MNFTPSVTMFLQSKVPIAAEKLGRSRIVENRLGWPNNGRIVRAWKYLRVENGVEEL